MHRNTFHDLLNHVVKDVERPRILISGSTDESMLDIVYSCPTLHGKNLSVDAVDKCHTPLERMSRYAKTKGIKLGVYCEDILDFDKGHSYDIIVTHAFMGYFDTVKRRLLVKRWRSLLLSGGHLITIQRIRDVTSPERVSFTPSQASNFVAHAISAAAKTDPSMASDDVRDVAKGFVENFYSYPITSIHDFKDLFISSGFSISKLSLEKFQAPELQLSGPSVPSQSLYACVAAKRV